MDHVFDDNLYINWHNVFFDTANDMMIFQQSIIEFIDSSFIHFEMRK